MLSYDACLTYLEQLPIPKEMTTQQVRRLMTYMGNPQDQLKVIHITGTNGKGSTSKMIESILLAAKYTTGLFSSPSLISINEGMQVNGQWINNIDFTISANKVFSHCRKMVDDGHLHPSNFECQVGIAIDYFHRNSVDIVIMEVGLGGKTDGTNIFNQPLLTAVTSIGLDHTEYLGNTITAIATHKSGIMRPKVPILIGLMNQAARQVFQDRATEIGAPIFDANGMSIVSQSHLQTVCETDIIRLLENNLKAYPANQKLVLTITQTESFHEKLLDDVITITTDLSLLGKHQTKNATLALLAINYLNHIGYQIPQKAIQQGFSSVQWPCRCEYFLANYNDKHQPILIDGAHNMDSIYSLVTMITETISHAPKKETVVLFSALKDKEIQLMLSSLATVSDHIICTQIDHPRGEKAEVIGAMAKTVFKKVEIIKTPTHALDYILNQLTCDLIIITGSLYLTMPLYKQYFDNQLDCTPTL